MTCTDAKVASERFAAMSPKIYRRFHRRVPHAEHQLTSESLAIVQDIEISRSTIDGGPGAPGFSAGGDFELSGTIGQPDGGFISGGACELSGGFWFPLPLGDCNSDGWVDLIDYDVFDGCLSGPGGGWPLRKCNCLGLDGNKDVDLSDAARFQTEFTSE